MVAYSTSFQFPACLQDLKAAAHQVQQAVSTVNTDLNSSNSEVGQPQVTNAVTAVTAPAASAVDLDALNGRQAMPVSF